MPDILYVFIFYAEPDLKVNAGLLSIKSHQSSRHFQRSSLDRAQQLLFNPVQTPGINGK